MRVGIEVSAAVANRRTGVGHYVANMVSGLQRLTGYSSDLEFLYFSNQYALGVADSGTGLAAAEIYPRDRFPSRLFWMQFGLSRSIARTHPDVCHFPNHLAPLTGTGGRPFVVTIYDMSVYRYPEHQPLKTVMVHRAMLPLLLRRNCVVATISESARRDIVEYLDIEPERVRVIYGGVADGFRPVSPRDTAWEDAIRRQYGLEFPYFLTVGTLEPRKNQARLIDAFSRLVQQERLPHHLVLVGTRGWKDQLLWLRANQSAVADRIHFLGYLPTGHLATVYRGADVFAFPSLYEGFGLPALEAMACGVPTLISTDPALLEVAGDGTALAVDPYSAEDIAAGLYRLATNVALRRTFSMRSVRRAQQFTWERCAAETLELYYELLGISTAPALVRAAR